MNIKNNYDNRDILADAIQCYIEAERMNQRLVKVVIAQSIAIVSLVIYSALVMFI